MLLILLARIKSSPHSNAAIRLDIMYSLTKIVNFVFSGKSLLLYSFVYASKTFLNDTGFKIGT